VYLMNFVLHDVNRDIRKLNVFLWTGKTWPAIPPHVIRWDRQGQRKAGRGEQA
jgi:hypothetical protein